MKDWVPSPGGDAVYVTSATRVVLLDIDEVLFPFAHAYDRWLRRSEGFGLDPEYVARYDIPAAAGPGHDQLVVRFLSDPDVIHGETAIPESLAVVNRLSSQFRLIACTSRHEYDEGDATRSWLRAQVPHVEDVVFTRFRRGGHARPKATVARELGAVVLVDDSPEHLVGLPRGCRGLLLLRPEGLPSTAGAATWSDVLLSLSHAHSE